MISDPFEALLKQLQVPQEGVRRAALVWLLDSGTAARWRMLPLLCHPLIGKGGDPLIVLQGPGTGLQALCATGKLLHSISTLQEGKGWGSRLPAVSVLGMVLPTPTNSKGQTNPGTWTSSEKLPSAPSRGPGRRSSQGFPKQRELQGIMAQEGHSRCPRHIRAIAACPPGCPCTVPHGADGGWVYTGAFPWPHCNGQLSTICVGLHIP